MKTLAVILSSALILLFAYTGIMKLMNMQEFHRELRAQVFSEQMASALWILLPAVELLLAAALAFERLRVIALWVSLGLLFLFTFYAALVVAGVFEQTPCPCGGLLRRLSWKQHLLFNSFAVIVCMAAICLEHASRPGKPKPRPKV